MDKIKQAGVGPRIIELWHAGYSSECIANLTGGVVTGRSVLRYLQRKGINTGVTGKVVRCEYCGKIFTKTRCVFRESRHHFCCREHYWAYEKDPEYRQSVSGVRKARNMVRSCGFLLAPKHVVHHKDGDRDNNDPGNLMVFACQSAHLYWHRNGGWLSGIKPVWPEEVG